MTARDDKSQGLADEIPPEAIEAVGTVLSPYAAKLVWERWKPFMSPPLDGGYSLRAFTPSVPQIDKRNQGMAASAPSPVVQNWRYIPANPPPKDTPIELLCADGSVARVDYYDGYGRFHDNRLSNAGGIFWRPVSVPSTTRQIDEHTALQLAAISVASIQNTRDSAKQRIGRDSPYWTQTYEDVCAAVDREMDQRERATRLYEIEHAAWHFLESGEERVSDKELAFDLPNEDYDKLVALLSDAHPEPGASVPSATPLKPEVREMAEETIGKAMSWIGGFICSGPGQEERRSDMIEECRDTLAALRRADGTAKP